MCMRRGWYAATVAAWTIVARQRAASAESFPEEPLPTRRSMGICTPPLGAPPPWRDPAVPLLGCPLAGPLGDPLRRLAGSGINV